MLKMDKAVSRMSDERPTTKMQLPFRASRHTVSGREAVVLEYDGVRGDGIKVPYAIEVLDPDNQLLEQQINPLGNRIIDLMQAFYSVEGKVDGLIKERDDLLLEQIETRGENERLKSKVAELERQKANAKNGSK